MQDRTYDLVSVLYHALQGAHVCSQYIQDVQQARDDVLGQFFQEVRECQQHLVQQAEALLLQRLQQRSIPTSPSTAHQHAADAGTGQGRSKEAVSISPGAELGAGAVTTMTDEKRQVDSAVATG
ncbi:MAG: hypothetical protein AB7N91_27920 [Candidatus Tectimicrobiota bacterium]